MKFFKPDLPFLVGLTILLVIHGSLVLSTTTTTAAATTTAENMTDESTTADESTTNPPPTTEEPSTEEKGTSSAGVYTKVLGHSGKIMVGRTENPAQDANRITVDMDEMAEIDAEGNAICGGGKVQHCVKSFAKLNFKFSSTQNVKYQNLSAVMFSFETPFRGIDATLKVEVYVMTEDGEIDIDNEITAVKDGNVKFNIGISQWPFCGTDGFSCAKGGGPPGGKPDKPGKGGPGGGDNSSEPVGEYLDFTVTIKGKGTPNRKSRTNSSSDADEYELGEGAGLKVSKKVQVDGMWRDMPEGYPKLETRGSKQSFIFRFPKFTSDALYDPVLEASSTVDLTGGTGIGIGTRMTPCLLTLIVTYLASMFAQKNV